MGIFNIFKKKQKVLNNNLTIDQSSEPQKRGKGRPKGSLNKPKPKRGQQINPIQYLRAKHIRMQGATGKETLLYAGQAETTAGHKVGSSKLLEVVDRDIERELLAKNLDVDYFIKKRERIIEKAENKKDYSNALRGIEGQERLTGIDKSTDQAQINVYNLPQTEEGLTNSILNRLKGLAKK